MCAIYTGEFACSPFATQFSHTGDSVTNSVEGLLGERASSHSPGILGTVPHNAIIDPGCRTLDRSMHGSSIIEAGGLSYKVLSQASGEEESVGPLRRRLSSAALCACTSFLTCVARRLDVPSTVHDAMAGHKNLLKMSTAMAGRCP